MDYPVYWPVPFCEDSIADELLSQVVWGYVIWVFRASSYNFRERLGIFLLAVRKVYSFYWSPFLKLLTQYFNVFSQMNRVLELLIENTKELLVFVSHLSIVFTWFSKFYVFLSRVGTGTWSCSSRLLWSLNHSSWFDFNGKSTWNDRCLFKPD